MLASPCELYAESKKGVLTRPHSVGVAETIPLERKDAELQQREGQWVQDRHKPFGSLRAKLCNSLSVLLQRRSPCSQV